MPLAWCAAPLGAAEEAPVLHAERAAHVLEGSGLSPTATLPAHAGFEHFRRHAGIAAEKMLCRTLGLG